MPSADNNRLYKGPLNDLLDDDFDQALKDVMQAWDIPGVSIALVREADGASEELIRCYGLRNRADPVTEDVSDDTGHTAYTAYTASPRTPWTLRGPSGDTSDGPSTC